MFCFTSGFVGEGGSALTEEEIKVLVSCADKDGNGMIGMYICIHVSIHVYLYI
jgi:Ca2+-binding EF-hand superfamily protein